MSTPSTPHAADGVHSTAAADARRRVVAAFDNYADAERAVDRLSDRGFPVQRTAIVARDLRFVEQVTGRVTTARAALQGAGSGALAGFLVGWLFGLFNWWDPVISSALLALWGLLIGAVVGALMGLLAHALTRGRRDFASVGSIQADGYEVMVDEDAADEATRILKTV
jgi:uncharacterized membrane protein